MLVALNLVSYNSLKLELIIILISISCLRIFAQNNSNLLLNGSFEAVTNRPNNAGQLSLSENWTVPNQSTPDLFCTKSDISTLVKVPQNFMGNQNSQDSDIYCGLALYHADTSFKNYREYIQGKLISPLIENSVYNVSMFISWAEISDYFCDRIGYSFSRALLNPDLEIKKKRKNRIKNNPNEINNIILKSSGYTILNYDSLIDRDRWHKVEFQYKAKGGELYFLIGLFGDNINNLTLDSLRNSNKVNRSSIGKAAYFYLDNLSVTEETFTH